MLIIKWLRAGMCLQTMWPLQGFDYPASVTKVQITRETSANIMRFFTVAVDSQLFSCCGNHATLCHIFWFSHMVASIFDGVLKLGHKL